MTSAASASASVGAANARAARQILDGKVVSHEMARALEEASTTVTPNRHVTPGGGGFGSPMPNGDGDFQFGFEFNDAVNDFEFHKKTAERLIPSIKSIDQMFSSIRTIESRDYEPLSKSGSSRSALRLGMCTRQVGQ